MGSSLTSGSNLRRKTPCLVCHTCTTMRSWWQPIATPEHPADQAGGRKECWAIDSGLLSEPSLIGFPLPCDVVFVRPLKWVLQPSRLLIEDIEMNVEVSTSVVLGYIAISLRCSTERNLSGRFVSLAACSRMTLSFVKFVAFVSRRYILV